MLGPQPPKQLLSTPSYGTAKYPFDEFRTPYLQGLSHGKNVSIMDKNRDELLDWAANARFVGGADSMYNNSHVMVDPEILTLQDVSVLPSVWLPTR